MASIKPKITLDASIIAATKQFTNRTGYIKAFWDSVDEIQRDDTKVLTYYGIGGIGKSSLRKKLQSEIDKKNQNIVWATIDFETKQHRTVENALIYIRSELGRKYKIKFPLFDCAYTYYLKKTAPHIVLNSESLPFIGEGELVADIITTFKDMPVVDVAMKISSIFSRSYKIYDKWITQKKIDQIVDISKKESNELLEYLPLYFAEDLQSFLSKNNDQGIIFIDTYEIIYTDSNNKKISFEDDEWLREVLIPNLPGVLFVILGREKLRWEDSNPEWSSCLEQHLIGKLADDDSRIFLNSCDIANDEVINAIIKITDGHPYSLDLCVDTYRTIGRNRPPTTEDFSFKDNQIKIFERFMRYLGQAESETLKVLSVPRFWDNDISQMLISKYNTGYPFTSLDELYSFSFISEETVNDNWKMYSLMRKSLQECQSLEQIKEINKTLFDHYSKKLEESDIDQLNQSWFNEAYYHGKKSIDTEIFFQWFVNTSKLFIKMGNISFLEGPYQDAWEDLKDVEIDSNLFLEISYNISKIYMDLGKYERAEKTLELSIEISNTNNPAKLLGLLATLQANTYKYKEADKNFSKAIKAYEILEKSEPNISNSIQRIKYQISYGKLNVYMSEDYEALEIYKKTIADINELIIKGEQIYTLLNCKAVALEKLGEVSSVIGNRELAGESYKEAIKVYEEIIDDYKMNLEEEGNLIYLINNKGMVYKRLAEYYVKGNEVMEAERCYREALDIYEGSINISPENIDTYKKVGFAARGLLRLLVNNSMNKHEIEFAFDKTIDAFDKAVELSPNDVAAIYSKGGAYRIMAKTSENELDYTKAIELYNIVIEQSNKAIGIQPDYFYAYNGKTEALMYLGDIQVILGVTTKALDLYREALETVEEILKRSPKAKSALKNKGIIEAKISNI